ncbi:hypothetical protein ETD85_60910, partial [Nonomuraea zeae]
MNTSGASGPGDTPGPGGTSQTGDGAGTGGSGGAGGSSRAGGSGRVGGAVRPFALAYPSPTASRFVLLLAALLSAGAFVGGWLHEQLHDDWISVAARCDAEAARTAAGLTPVERRALLPRPESLVPPGSTGPAEPGPIELGRYELAGAHQVLLERCLMPSARRTAGFALGGVALAAAAGLAVLFLAPVVIERRRRLRPLGPMVPQAAERVAVLAAEAGLARVPEVFLGPATLRDGYGFGRPGRYRIVLPQAVAVRWRKGELFDPLVRHELAHVAHRDVALAWLARSVGYVLAPLLVLPVVVMLLAADRSLLPGYAWRVLLLAVTALLVSRSLLRSREHDADLRAARAGGGPAAFTAILARARDQDASPWYRRLPAYHPSPARRRAVLERPELAVDVTFLDGFSAAFLAALTVPLVVGGLTGVLTTTGRTDLAFLVPAVLTGLLLGGSAGLGLWRAALVRRAAGGPARVVPVAMG